MPATVDALKIHLGLDPASTVDAAAMAQDVAAANAYVQGARPDVTLDPDDGTPLSAWPPDIDMGAILLAAKVYGRRGSVSGVAGFADLGVAYIARFDPDVQWLLGLGDYQSPVIA